MRYLRPLYLAGMTLAVATSLAVPLRGTAQAATHVTSSSAAGTLDFDTTLTGPTSDRKHTVSVEVARNTSAGLVEVTVNVNSSSIQNFTGGTYKFDLPMSDLKVTNKGATLDTHAHLGKYGHITAQWTYTSSSTTVKASGGCTPGVSTTVTRILASGSANLALSFPCDGAVIARLQGKNLDIDNGNAPPSTSSRASQGLQSIYFTGAFAARSTKTGTQTNAINVGAYNVTGGPSLFVASVDTSSSATSGLVETTHIASDSLSAGSLTVGPPAKLHYSGVLGKANLQFTSTASPFTFTESGACIAPGASKADQAKSVTLSSSMGTASGPINLKVCTVVKTTFGHGDSGFLISTSVATTPAPGPGPNPNPGPGTGTGMSVSKLTPADGATGVSTTAPISVTLTAAPKDGRVTMILTEADNPAGFVLLPPATYDAGTMTATTTPTTPLKPNTKYKLTIVAIGATSGFISSSTTFTTGS